MSMLHYRANNKRKWEMTHADRDSKRPCAFCDTSQMAGIIEETETMRIIQNRAPYDLFDNVRVRGHLMIAPKQHRDSLVEFTEQERHEYFDLLASYEAKGYTIYSRAQTNQTRTAGHTHTHLLLLTDRRFKAVVYMEKPYFVLHPGRFSKANKIQG